MKDAINVNVFLCEKYDKDNKNIFNIFNKLKVGGNQRASFTIFTIISNRLNNNRTNGKFGLHYYLTKDEGKKIRLYVGSLSARFCDDNEEGAESQLMAHMEMKGIPFLECGKYKLEVYLSENIVDGEFKEIKEHASEIAKDEQLVAIYPVEIIF